MTPFYRQSLPALAFSPLPLSVVAIVVLYFRGTATSHESAALLLVLNILCTTFVSVLIAIAAGRSFLVSGRPTLLAICSGMIVWGASALVAVIGEHVGNYNITIHNLGVAVSGLFQLAGGFAAHRQQQRPISEPGAWLSVGIAVALCAVGAIWMSTQEGWLPPFFIEGVGATDLRQAIVVASAGMYALAAALAWSRYRLSKWRFLFWYSLGLGLIAAGAIGLVLQPTHGSWLGWVARLSQYAGGIYIFLGAVTSMRESGSWDFSLEERLIRSERKQREQTNLIRTINDNTNELIFMKDRKGRLIYANAATLRLLGRDILAGPTRDREFFRAAEEHPAVTDNDRSVMETGQTIEAEEVFTGADGVTRTFLSTKSPLRDSDGEIVGVIGVSRDITERISVRKQLQQALDDAEAAGAALREADRRKDEFLAMLSHELRNPLAPLRSGLQVMKLARKDADAVEQVRGMMERQVEHMVRLVDDLLDVNRITTGRLELRRERITVAEVVANALEACDPAIRECRHELVVAMPDAAICIDADKTRLAQVLSNLLTNAAKYTDPGGRISLTVSRDGGDVLISVQDNGSGIPADMLPRIFEVFTQVDRSMERSQGGLGIGLALAKRLVEMHDGSIEARSEGPAMGSTFVVRLPVAAMLTAHQGVQDVEPTGSSARRRILVVDDNQDVADSLAALLGEMGHEIRVAYDGQESLAVAAEFRPDVIMLDIGMPHMDGYEVCRRLRQQSWGRKVIAVALTGWGRDDDKRESREAGFDCHLVKPVDPAALEELLAA